MTNTAFIPAFYLLALGAAIRADIHWGFLAGSLVAVVLGTILLDKDFTSR